MTTDRQPSAAAKAWVQKEWGSPSHEEDLLEAFDAGAAAERERECVWKWNRSGKYLINPHRYYVQDDPRDEGDNFCPYCGGKISVKEER